MFICWLSNLCYGHRRTWSPQCRHRWELCSSSEQPHQAWNQAWTWQSPGRLMEHRTPPLLAHKQVNSATFQCIIFVHDIQPCLVKYKTKYKLFPEHHGNRRTHLVQTIKINHLNCYTILHQFMDFHWKVVGVKIKCKCDFTKFNSCAVSPQVKQSTVKSRHWHSHCNCIFGVTRVYIRHCSLLLVG